MAEGGTLLRVVLAPDKFKGSLTASEVADAVAAGMRDSLPELETILLPVADGGDGTVAAALSARLTRSSSTPSVLLASRCRRRTRCRETER